MDDAQEHHDLDQEVDDDGEEADRQRQHDCAEVLRVQHNESKPLEDRVDIWLHHQVSTQAEDEATKSIPVLLRLDHSLLDVKVLHDDETEQQLHEFEEECFEEDGHIALPCLVELDLFDLCLDHGGLVHIHIHAEFELDLILNLLVGHEESVNG
jgi:hypothetical protein